MSAAARVLEPAAGVADASGPREQACRQLLDLTVRIRDGLQAGDWAAAADFEAERRGLLECIFDGPPSATELAPMTETLREVVRLNDELIGLAEHRRRALERDVDTVALGRAAVRAYADAGVGARP